MSKSKSDFESLFGGADQPLPPLGIGSLVEGLVERIEPDAGEAVVRLPDESIGRVSFSECLPKCLSPGDRLLFLIIKQAAPNQNCHWLLVSRIAKRMAAWTAIAESQEGRTPLRWQLVRKVYGGWEIEIDGVRGYWPAAGAESEDLQPGTEHELTVVSFDQQIQSVLALSPAQLQRLQK